jgi:iron complex transport system ATP-binding protein
MKLALAGRDRAVPDRRRVGDVVAVASQVDAAIGRVPILHGVDLEVRAGEVLALVGPNGAGKSTLLGVLAGDLAHSGGSVEIDGQPLGGWAPVELARRRAVLPQQVTVSFPFTVADVVRMGRAPWARTEAEDDDEAVIAAVLRLTDTVHLARRAFPSLSGGERARVALARVLAQRAQLLLLDEPTAALDVRHQELVLEVARDQAAAGDAVVTVLHDLGLAAAHADRVAVVADGRVVADGAPDDVMTPARLSDVYQHDIEVIEHPHTGALLVLPRRT